MRNGRDITELRLFGKKIYLTVKFITYTIGSLPIHWFQIVIKSL